MSEKVQIKLKCPVCGRVGTAYVRESSDYGWMRGDRDVSVVSMPEGFVAVHREGSSWNGAFDIDCTEDGVSAIARA
ncbi:hypothetical protein [Methylobacterium brachiatum]|uniref:hypothetical protein n=1 Tax=Methylobacterium brachiatum TaxID=269660 RepID=UPI0013CE824C|nr:hypothetical protein [Methylobacterium brachiatum]MDH2310325.1 hypothetical protein [Methylobacterium brachiatum]